MFEMEGREGRGKYCQVFPAGSRLDGVSLEPGELVYGIYKDKYLFTPKALILRTTCEMQRLPWAQISACSTEHGSGEKLSILTLSSGARVTIELHELVEGWSGRISQLLHGMIQRWGSRASLGPALLSVEEFFRRAEDPYEFAPNLEPHPTLATIREWLYRLESAVGVKQVLLSPANADEHDFAITGVVVTASGRPALLDEFATALQASDVLEAAENTRQKVTPASGEVVWEVLWD
jgi:hypothetical protein